MARWEPMREELVRLRYGRLVAFASMLVPSRDEAEDLVQDALVATFSGRARFDVVAEAEAYVRRAVVSRSVDVGRRRAGERRAWAREHARRGQYRVELAVPGVEPAVERALAALSPRVRACVVLRHMEDLPTGEPVHAGRVARAGRRGQCSGLRRLCRVGASERRRPGHRCAHRDHGYAVGRRRSLRR